MESMRQLRASQGTLKNGKCVLFTVILFSSPHPFTCAHMHIHAPHVIGYQLSFTLLNPDPSTMEVGWNIHDATESKWLVTVR